MLTTNYFENRLGAERYAEARPPVHATALARFQAFSPILAPVARALDVGCGTGQSTEALLMFANHVVGVDSSAEMLSACRAHPNIEYRQSAAETIPAEAESFDLITVAHAFHWFDQDAFLAEASRVLRTQCWLVIYTSGFTAEMKENAGFAAWFKDEYLTRYPAPPRNLSPIQHAQASRYGFALRGEDRFSDEIRMTVERFTDYQLSTTNVLANASDESAMFEAERWIRKSIRPFFDSEDERTFLFTGRIWFLQKEAG